MSNTETNTGVDSDSLKDLTAGEHLDETIQYARKRLERLCVTKAKLEAMQMLNVPMSILYQTVYP